MKTSANVVLDTNILISACLKPGGLEAQVVAMVQNGGMTTHVTEEIRAEYRDVLLRPKFHGMRARAEALLAAIDALALPCTAGTPVSAASDEDDNRFLECAAACQADYLVTGNLRHFPALWNATRVVNSRGLLDELDVHPVTGPQSGPPVALQLP